MKNVSSFVLSHAFLFPSYPGENFHAAEREVEDDDFDLSIEKNQKLKALVCALKPRIISDFTALTPLVIATVRERMTGCNQHLLDWFRASQARLKAEKKLDGIEHSSSDESVSLDAELGTARKTAASLCKLCVIEGMYAYKYDQLFSTMIFLTTVIFRVIGPAPFAPYVESAVDAACLGAERPDAIFVVDSQEEQYSVLESTERKKFGYEFDLVESLSPHDEVRIDTHQKLDRIFSSVMI
jgi:hypothetical protein